MSEHTHKFEPFTDEQLDDIAVAFTSAAGEGAFGNIALARELVDEFERRGRDIPIAYSEHRCSAEDWLSWAEVA